MGSNDSEAGMLGGALPAASAAFAASEAGMLGGAVPAAAFAASAAFAAVN